MSGRAGTKRDPNWQGRNVVRNGTESLSITQWVEINFEGELMETRTSGTQYLSVCLGS